MLCLQQNYHQITRQASLLPTSLPISKMGKLRHREVTQLSKGHTATEKWSLDSQAGLAVAEPWAGPQPSRPLTDEVRLGGPWMVISALLPPNLMYCLVTSKVGGMFILSGFCFFLAGILFCFVANPMWLSQRWRNLWLAFDPGNGESWCE